MEGGDLAAVILSAFVFNILLGFGSMFIANELWKASKVDEENL